MSRIEKVNELIKEEVSKCMPQFAGDEVGFVTVLKADLMKIRMGMPSPLCTH